MIRTVAHAQVVVDGTSIGITMPAATIIFTKIRMSISDGGDIRGRLDGTDPTSSVGAVYSKGRLPSLISTSDWNKWRAIRDGSLIAKVEVEFILND